MAQKINIFDEIRFDAKSRNRSIEWYMQKVKELKSRGLVTQNKLFTYDEMLTNDLEVGSMYLYIYDPKYKATLPVYDVFPLCLPFGADKDTFTGFNLHYVPQRVRWALLKELSKINNFSVAKNKIENDRKMQLSWELLRNSAKASVLEPCIHKYLYTHVISRSGGKFLKIDPNDWHMAILLPVEDFRKGSTKTRKGYSSVKSSDVWKGKFYE